MQHRRAFHRRPIVRISAYEPKLRHTPIARDPDDRGSCVGSGVPAGDGGDVLAGSRAADGGRDDAVGNDIARNVSGYDGRDGKRNAVLSVERRIPGRLRQVRLHGGLRVRMLRRRFGEHLSSVSDSVRYHCAPAQ